MYAAGTAGFQKIFHFGYRHHVVVTLDRMLKRRSGYGKIDGALGVLAGKKRVDKTCAERIAAADAVNDVQIIFLREAVVFAVL